MRQVAGGGCRTFEQAVTKLGVQKVRSIMAETSSHRVTDLRDPKTVEATRLLWDHARAVAILAQSVAVLAGVEEPGLFHGRAAARYRQARGGDHVTRSRGANRAAQSQPVDRWRHLGGRGRANAQENRRQFGQKWQFPEEVQSAVLVFSDYDAANRQSITNAVHFANALVKQLGIYLGDVSADDNDALVMVGRSLLGIDDDGIARVTADIKARCRLA